MTDARLAALAAEAAYYGAPDARVGAVAVEAAYVGAPDARVGALAVEVAIDLDTVNTEAHLAALLVEAAVDVYVAPSSGVRHLALLGAGV